MKILLGIIKTIVAAGLISLIVSVSLRCMKTGGHGAIIKHKKNESVLHNKLTELAKRLDQLKKNLGTLRSSLNGLKKNLDGSKKIVVSKSDSDENVRIAEQAKEYRAQAEKFKKDAKDTAATVALLKKDGLHQQAASIQKDVDEFNANAAHFEQLAKDLEATLKAAGHIVPIDPIHVNIPGPQRANAGLKNCNLNDCFFSSSFQVLSQIDPFIQDLKQIPQGLLTEVQREFLDFIDSLRGQGRGKYDPSENATKIFRDFITNPAHGNNDLAKLGPKEDEDKPASRDDKGNPTGKYDYNQEDAQEFFSAFLDVLTDIDPKSERALFDIFKNIFNLFTKINPRGFSECYRRSLTTVAAMNKNNFVQVVRDALAAMSPAAPEPEPSSIHDLNSEIEKTYDTHSQQINQNFVVTNQLSKIREIFNVGLFSTLRCKLCQNEWRSGKGSELLVPIELPNEKEGEVLGTIGLLERMQYFFNAEDVSDFRCKFCAKSGGVVKQMVLLQPKILTIQLKRFSFDWEKGIPKKLKRPISFPLVLRSDDLQPFVEKDPAEYALFGVVVQTGSLSGGHYRAYTKDRFDQKWREYNDATYPFGRLLLKGEIDQIAAQTLERGAPYMLFYQKI